MNLSSQYKKMAGTLNLCNDTIRRKTAFKYSLFLILKPRIKMIRGKHIGFTQMKMLQMISKENMFVKSNLPS